MSDRSDDSMPEWTEEELGLLRSADRDRPPSRSLPAAIAAVSVGSAIVSGTAAAHGVAAAGAGIGAATAKWGGIAVISKWLAVVALGGTVVASGVVLSKRSEVVSKPAAPAAREAAPSARPAPATLPPAVEAAPAPSESAARPTTTGAAPATARPPAAKRAVSQPDIRHEIAALDAARTALRAGKAQQALVTLDRYDATYAKSGALRVEATALRIEALVRAGDRSKAAKLASEFQASHPRSPYAARIRALLGPRSSAPAKP